ncbi:MAG: polymer-forming cytoskeletal protein [Thermoanaerobaculaceae bacterium]|jgi:hypothetical protein|nr:polymer-forming cytoskeletal protein [Thermoanaerobaculaceae bacterium]
MTLGLLLTIALVAAPPPSAGSNIHITRPTSGPVVSLLGDIRVDALVDGDVVALGGDVVLGEAAEVTGEVVTVGGAVSGVGTVRGRAVAIGALGMGTATRSSGGLRTALGLHCLRVGGWLLLGTAVLLLLPRAIHANVQRVRCQPLRALVIGLVTLALWLAATILAAVVVRSAMGAGLLLLGTGVLLVIKTVGIVTSAWWLGERSVAILPVGLRGEVPRTGLALAALTVLSALPVVGPATWVAANVLGIGAVTWGLAQRLPVRWYGSLGVCFAN